MNPVIISQVKQAALVMIIPSLLLASVSVMDVQPSRGGGCTLIGASFPQGRIEP